MNTFTFFSDSGHAWLRVSYTDVLSVGLNSGSFSRYSYQDRSWLYLEEDCDAAKFINAYRAVHKIDPTITDVHTRGNSVIRNKARLGG